MASTNPPGGKAKRGRTSSVEAGCISGAENTSSARSGEGTGQVTHESVSGTTTQKLAEPLPPFDDSRAIAAEVLAYGDPASKDRKDQSSAIEAGHLGHATAASDLSV